ncbi:MAG: hypothetical protein JRJ58_19085, partial [Deltaproteobacteria bacterium]|nr:hypothetical protein [Deltaproteobacteria bacterium]
MPRELDSDALPPSHPPLAPGTEMMPGAIYSPFAERIADHCGPIFPLHVGDTWRDAFEGARAEDLSS